MIFRAVVIMINGERLTIDTAAYSANAALGDQHCLVFSKGDAESFAKFGIPPARPAVCTLTVESVS